MSDLLPQQVSWYRTQTGLTLLSVASYTIFLLSGLLLTRIGVPEVAATPVGILALTSLVTAVVFSGKASVMAIDKMFRG
jgi:hypothetical protein